VRDYLDVRNFEAANTIIQGMIKGAPGNSDLNYLAGVAWTVWEKGCRIDQLKQVAPGSRFFQNAAVHAALLYQEMEQLQAAIDFLLKPSKKIRKIQNSPLSGLFLRTGGGLRKG
jgi:hypothetical protein